jgi:beta-glucosidase
MTALTVDGQQPAFRNPELSVQERVDDLLERMTLDEKVAQIGSVWVFELLEGEDLSFERARALLRNGLGQITRVSGASNLGAEGAARMANSIQRFLLEETRLGIPAIIHEEICSGLMAREATVFPQAIGVASTWDADLAGAMADVVRRQMRAVGAHQGLSPVLDICRDPRWGRLEETFGEDPHLVARMGVAFVRGLQGSDLDHGVVATAKHFVGYGASEGGLNWAPAHIPPREMHDVYLHPFEAVVKTAGLRSVMNGYHELDGTPCGAHRGLLTGLLRETWGFEGTVVSDYFAVRQLENYHHLAVDGSHAAAIALEAGIDVELPGTDCYGGPLLEAIRSGAVDQGLLDIAVRRVLRSKFELGLFDRPFVELETVRLAFDNPLHRELAATTARKSMVLLTNNGILPLEKNRSVAVIGPNAHDARNLFGGYTYVAHVESLLEMHSRDNVFSIPVPEVLDLDATLDGIETVFEAMRNRFGDNVVYARGCDVGGSSRDGFGEAVALAAESDVAVLVMGDKSGLTDDCTSGEGRDRASLDLPGVQEELVRAVLATGTPVVLVIVGGRPAGSAWVHENCAAVLMAWLPGAEGAVAIADVLTGSANPGGKLPVTYPRSVGQLPIYYGHKVSGGRSHWKVDYVDSPSSPLYPFGHGLSYTTFSLSNLSIGPDQVTGQDSVTITARLTNTGTRQGDEVVQLYVRDPLATLTRPVLELKGFARVELAPGESKLLTFELPAGQVGFHDSTLRYVVEPGTIDVLVGTSSENLAVAGCFTVLAESAGVPSLKAFDGAVHVD